MAKTVFLVLTAAIAIGGEIAKSGTTVEVSEAEAYNLVEVRGKARPATDDEIAEALEAAALAATEEAEAAAATAAEGKKKAKGSPAADDKDKAE